MRMMMKTASAEGKTAAIALLSSMQPSLSAWLAMSPAPEQHPASSAVWRGQLYEVIRGARSAGLGAYSSLSLRIGEQLEPSFRTNDPPRWAVELLFCWSYASLRYLRCTVGFSSAVDLVGLLSLSRLRDYYGAEERACLLRSLIEEQQKDARLGAREAAKPDRATPGRHDGA